MSHKIDLGGELQVGDLIGVAYSNAIEYGWYVPGRTSLMFVRLGAPVHNKNHFDEYQAQKAAGTRRANDFLDRRFKKGFTFNCVSRDFITSWERNRVFKVDNPEEFFKGSSNEKTYTESKIILNDVKFPAK